MRTKPLIVQFSEAVNYRLLKSGVECQSDDQRLVDGSLSECADACSDINECHYFIIGTGGKEGLCWWEKTENGTCPEGWEVDEYDFYEMIGKLWRINS